MIMWMEVDFTVLSCFKLATALYSCLFVIAAIQPIKYESLIKLIGWSHIILGMLLLVNGLLLRVVPIFIYTDAAFCLCAGTGILGVNRKLQRYRLREIENEN